MLAYRLQCKPRCGLFFGLSYSLFYSLFCDFFRSLPLRWRSAFRYYANVVNLC